MSDNFIVLGVGGAGVNVVRALGYKNSLLIDSYQFGSIEGVLEFVKAQGREENVILVSSPAGAFSSAVLKSVCAVLKSKGSKVFFIGIMPFHSESPERKMRGDAVVKELRKSVEAATIVENENFASSMMEYSWPQVLTRINDYIDGLVKNIISRNQDKYPTEGISTSTPEMFAEFKSSVNVSLQ
ncbi:MAG: hypothetical protein QXU18_03180 [Thermoplasmatales archaeon]